MKKVLVIGCPGSGKSTFARGLRDKTGLPLYPLDLMYWNPDGTCVDRDLFRQRLEKVLSGEAWIIDGNYAATLPMRLAACDTVFFLDLPVEQCLQGVRSRLGKPRPDMPFVDGEDEAFLDFIRSFPRTTRPEMLALLEAAKDKKIIRFGSHREADEYLRP